MRVLQVGKYYEPEMGGIETHLAFLSRGLKARGVDVEVVVHHRSARTVKETRGGIPVTRVGTLGKFMSTELSPAMMGELSREYDLVHIHAPHPMGMLAYLGSRKPKRHALVVSHHSDIVRQARARALLSPILGLVMSRAAIVIAASHAYMNTSNELAPFRARTRVIPYGIELSEFPAGLRECREARAVRERYPTPITLAVGRLIYYKGFDVLIDAFADVPGTLLIVGEGPLRAELGRRARTNGVEGRVHFLSAISNEALRHHYGAADAFVLPSTARSEAFGIVQIEALAAGLPVVNTQIDSGVPEVSVSGLTGITVAPSDARALAQALVDIFESPARAAEFGRAGRIRALHNFGQERMVDQTLEAYREALATVAGTRAFAPVV